MKKILTILFLIMINNISFADHKEFECTNMLAPWNSMFCNKKKTNDYMRKKGFNQRYFWK